MSEELKGKVVEDDGKPVAGAERPDAEFIAAMKGVDVEGGVAQPVKEEKKEEPPVPEKKVEATVVKKEELSVVPVPEKKEEPPVVASPANPTIVDFNKAMAEIAAANKSIAEAVKPKEQPVAAPKVLSAEELFPVSEEEADSLLAGGKQAAEALQQIQVRNMRTMARLVSEELEKMKREVIAPLASRHRQSVAEETKARFFTAYPDLKEWEQECFQIGQAALAEAQAGRLQFPTEADFHKHIADQGRKLRDTYMTRLKVVAAPVVGKSSGGVPPPPAPAPSSRRASSDEAGLSAEQKEMKRLLEGQE